MPVLNTKVKPFRNQAVQRGQFIEVTDKALHGKWAVLVFYPADFSLVCPSELENLAEYYNEFQKLGVVVYAVSTDSQFAHKAWYDYSPTIQKCDFALIADPSGALSSSFDALDEATGFALRATFVIDPSGLIKLYEVHDNRVARDARELVLKLKIMQYQAAYPDELCPAGWRLGEKTILEVNPEPPPPLPREKSWLKVVFDRLRV